MQEHSPLPPSVNAFLSSLRTWARRWRVPLALIGVLVLVGGIGVSISALGLRWSSISWPLIALNFFVLAPAGLALSAVSLQQLAQAAGRKIGFATGFSVSAIGRIAEILPLPGGALVRGAALVRSGASVKESSLLMAVAGLLAVAMSVALSGGALALSGYTGSEIVLSIGIIGVTVCSFLIWRRAGLKLAMWMFLLRLLVLALGAARLVATFSAIGHPVSGIEAAIFIVCITLATVATIIPAGLGVAETAAAGLALYVDIPPAAAFLAVGLNSIIGRTASGIVALIAIWRANATVDNKGEPHLP